MGGYYKEEFTLQRPTFKETYTLRRGIWEQEKLLEEILTGQKRKIRILREVYPKKGMKGCLAALPHRTKSACVNRINYWT